jgi:hypothetical protein
MICEHKVKHTRDALNCSALLVGYTGLIRHHVPCTFSITHLGGACFWLLLYVHLSITRLVGFPQLQHIWKTVLARFLVVPIIPSCILAFSLIWRPRNGVSGMSPHTNLFSGQSMIDPDSTFLYPTGWPVRNITHLIFKCKTPNKG